MSPGAFFDSNVLIYVVAEDVAKAEIAEGTLARGGSTSVQALNEFAWVSFRKLKKTIGEIRQALIGIRSLCDVVGMDIQTHELGLEIAERYKFSIYDSMLIAAALQAGCTTFYSEDLQHSQVIDGLTIRNPFIS
jgi:predicted nucleic acid-binding protein